MLNITAKVGDRIQVSPLLGKVMEVMDQPPISPGYSYLPTENGIKMAYSHFGDDHIGLIDFLGDVLEINQLEQHKVKVKIVGQIAYGLIEKSFGNDLEAAVRALLRIGDLLIDAGESELGGSCMSTGFEYSRLRRNEALMRSCLVGVERAGDVRNCQYERALELQIAYEKDGSPDSLRRLKLAARRLSAKDVERARSWLLPLVSGSDQSSLVFLDAAQKMADSYRGKNDDEFLNWQLAAGVSTWKEHRALGDVYFRKGMRDQAADHYRRAFDLMDAD